MNMNKGLQIIGVVLAMGISLTLAYANVKPEISYAIAKVELDSIISQKDEALSDTEKELFEVYYNDRLLGIIQDEKKLDTLLNEVYETRYSEDFPNTELWFSEEIFVKNVITYERYEDKDAEILDYLDQEDLFSVLTNKIEFSNGEVAYVKNIDDFKSAREIYIQNYVSKEVFDLVNKNQRVPELVTYGSREVTYEVLESATVTQGLSSVSKILKNREECLSFLSYGYDIQPEYYYVKEFDTIEGIAWQNSLSKEHIMAINADRLISENQILEVGMEIDVTKPNSPINIMVEREKFVREQVIPPPVQYVYDPEVREGITNTIQNESYGEKNVKYKETYINGNLVSGEIISELVTTPAQSQIISIGTKVIPSIGTGNFRYPVDNVRITCRWGCYYGHQGLDVQNAYNRYGPVRASDRGVVVTNAYQSINGYYMIIDHNNGYQTYYGHMSGPGIIPVGATVSQGEQIGNIGMTGLATGPHVHFEIRKSGVKMDPCIFLAC